MAHPSCYLFNKSVTPHTSLIPAYLAGLKFPDYKWSDIFSLYKTVTLA